MHPAWAPWLSQGHTASPPRDGYDWVTAMAVWLVDNGPLCDLHVCALYLKKKQLVLLSFIIRTPIPGTTPAFDSVYGLLNIKILLFLKSWEHNTDSSTLEETNFLNVRAPFPLIFLQ